MMSSFTTVPSNSTKSSPSPSAPKNRTPSPRPVNASPSIPPSLSHPHSHAPSPPHLAFDLHHTLLRHIPRHYYPHPSISPYRKPSRTVCPHISPFREVPAKDPAGYHLDSISADCSIRPLLHGKVRAWKRVQRGWDGVGVEGKMVHEGSVTEERRIGEAVMHGENWAMESGMEDALKIKRQAEKRMRELLVVGSEGMERRRRELGLWRMRRREMRMKVSMSSGASAASSVYSSDGSPITVSSLSSVSADSEPVPAAPKISNISPTPTKLIEIQVPVKAENLVAVALPLKPTSSVNTPELHTDIHTIHDHNKGDENNVVHDPSISSISSSSSRCPSPALCATSSSLTNDDVVKRPGTPDSIASVATPPSLTTSMVTMETATSTTGERGEKRVRFALNIATVNDDDDNDETTDLQEINKDDPGVLKLVRDIGNGRRRENLKEEKMDGVERWVREMRGVGVGEWENVVVSKVVV